MNSKKQFSNHFFRYIALFLLFILQFPLSNFVHASHFMGGEITWKCDDINGKYHFLMRLYRECGANAVYYNQMEIVEIINYPSLGKVTKIKMNLKNITDNSPLCNITGPKISCATASQPNMGAISEYYYTSDTLANTSGVTLSGTPPAEGWIIAYKSPGFNKRNASNNIINADLQTWALRAIMYPYKGQNTNPCYDNSPTFAEKPSTIICTGYHFTYNPNAYDNELDSLVYEWAQPLDSGMNVINSYVAGFNYQNPLPGPSINPGNISATIDPNTGEISFLSLTQGSFLTVSKVTAYKNKIKVAEIYREMQIVLLACNANTPPGLTPPFKGNTSFIDTVYAGEVVDFHLTATDDIGQLITLNATGADFGGINCNSSTVGCLTPPCATLNPPTTLSGSSPVETQFHWQTTCDHLAHPITVGSKSHLIYNQPTLSNVHNFVISVQDDFCSVPGKNVSTISIVVLNKPILPAPSLRCVSVAANGDVDLSWVPPIDTDNSFYRYILYYSLNPSGPFSVLDSIKNPATSTFTHTGANAKTQVVYYYLKSLSGCNHVYESAPGDTLSTIKLSATNANNGTANLVWNALHNPPLASSGNYDVYREYPTGSWKLIDGTAATKYVDTITICNAFINYRIEMPDQSGCKSVSTVSGDLFKDNTQPATPLIDTVSVDNALKQSVIGWIPTTSKDAVGYIIYEFKNNVWTAIDTVRGINTTSYINKNSTPYNGFESYSIAAFDSCKNLSPTSPPHHTLLLAAALDICNGTITLSWNKYSNMKGLKGYNLYFSENNSPTYTLLSSSNTTVTSFVHTNLLPGTNYCYFVQAYDSSGLRTSSSNIKCILSILSQKPKYTYIRYATVVQESSGDEHVDIRFISDSASYIKKYVILRSDSADGFFSPLKTITANGQYDVTYSDMSTFPAKQSYSYQVAAYDSCGNIAVTSNIGRSIFLTGTANNDLTNDINWRYPYIQWDGTVSGYKIYRDIGNTNNFSLLANVPPVVSTYMDDISSMTIGEGYFTYIVEALETPGTNFPFSDKSRSNKAVVLQQPKYFIPNAFNPESGNHSFTPIGIFNNESEYYFAIFSRWGIKVFESFVPNEGWNGTFNGSPAPFGTYAYILRYKDAVGKRLIKKGSVTLVR